MFSPEALEAARLIDRLERLARADLSNKALNPAQWEALRYLARANRFSRAPAALADYLGSTRGTVSQTLIALEQKGYLTRRPSARDGRSIDLRLTSQGLRSLRDDPLLAVARDLEKAAGQRLGDVVESLRATLRIAIARNGGRAFGACHTCRHFRRAAAASSLHHCALLGEPLSEEDSLAICVEQEPLAA